ncbi:MAG: hypothetical protein A3D94_02755 [Alphaproteobacteria bacterium RIFCSPHIGHO2_12_FULL_66_14]|nr:MAG: hypothetical protein A3D94_02755 [Alphaproteobacteria bacterium RIFCSPHIGHO2_12_FULL_66_14]
MLNIIDRFQADAANGLNTVLQGSASYNWNFQFGAGDSAPGPIGLFLGLTGHMTDGSRDFVAPVAEGGLDLGNVKIGTAAGGGLVVIEEVSNGTAGGAPNTGEFLFQTGVVLAPDVEAFDVKWTAINPFPGMPEGPTVRQLGGFIGTGDQDNFLKVVAGPNGTGNIEFTLESNGVTVATQTLNAAGLLTASSGSSLVFGLAVDRATSMATPSVTYAGSGGPVTVTGDAIDLAGTSILAAIDGEFTVQGDASGLAVGLWSSNTGEGSQTTFQAAFDDILITTTAAGGDQLIKAVNVGGGQVTVSSGLVYEADGGPATGGAESQVFTSGADIAGTVDDALYNSERWTPGGSYTYEVPVANGTYRVELDFAEIYYGITGAGQRVFDMALEGQALAPLQDIDIYGQVGANTALTISQLVTVSDGSLSIQVGPGGSAAGNVENAKLNAFAVFGTGGSEPPSLSIAAASAIKNEGDGGSTAFTFTVSRTGELSGTSAAAWAVSGSGAAAASASDFAGGVLPSGTVTFGSGESSQTITVNVAGDGTVEADEGFTVTLSAPSAGTTIATASAAAAILNDDDATPSAASAKLQITPGTPVNASTYNQPSYELTNLGATAITSLTIDLHNSLIAGNVFDPLGTFGDTTALDFTPYASPVPATWSFGPSEVTEGGYKTLSVNFGSGGLAASQTFGFRIDADPASIDGPSPGPNEAGSISGFEHIGASVTIGLSDGSQQTVEVFTQGTAGGGTATFFPTLLPEPVLSISTTGGVPLVTDSVGGILKANLPGLNDLAGSAGDDILVGVTGTAGQTVRLSISEIGGLGLDIPLGSHEGNTVLQDPIFVDVVLGADGTASVPIALPAETPAASLEAGSVSARFAITAAIVDPVSGEAKSLVSSTLVVKDSANSFISETVPDTFTFREGFATTDIFAFVATGANHDVIELEQALFPGMTVSDFLNSGALSAGAGAGDVDITVPSDAEIHLHDPGGTLTVALLQAHPEDFRFV